MGRQQSSGEGTSFADRQQSSGEASLSSDKKLDLRESARLYKGRRFCRQLTKSLCAHVSTHTQSAIKIYNKNGSQNPHNITSDT